MKNNEIALNYSRERILVGQNTTRTKVSRETASDRDLSFLDILEEMATYSDSDRQIPSHRSEVYEAWRATINNGGPFSHMFTLSFMRAYSDVDAMSALRAWCAMMNREIRGRRWKKRANGISGIAFAERHSVSLDFRGRLHFHVLIQTDPGLPNTSTLQDIAYETALLLKDKSERRMTDYGRIDLREVTNQRGLIGYLLKDLYSSDWQAGDNIGFWNAGSGMEGFRLSPLSAKQLRERH